MKNVILTLVTVLAFNLGNAQDVITTKGGETIEAFKSTVKNVYDNDLRKWVKGIAYKDENGNAKQITLSEVSEYKPCAETMLKINPVNEFKTEFDKEIEADVISATELNEKQQAEISGALEKRLARKVKLNCSVDPTLIAGVKIKAGDTVIDGSVKSKLNRLTDALQA